MYSVAAVLTYQFCLQALHWNAWLTGAGAWTLKIDDGHLIGPCGYL